MNRSTECNLISINSHPDNERGVTLVLYRFSVNPPVVLGAYQVEVVEGLCIYQPQVVVHRIGDLENEQEPSLRVLSSPIADSYGDLQSVSLRANSIGDKDDFLPGENNIRPAEILSVYILEDRIHDFRLGSEVFKDVKPDDLRDVASIVRSSLPEDCAGREALNSLVLV